MLASAGYIGVLVEYKGGMCTSDRLGVYLGTLEQCDPSRDFPAIELLFPDPIP